MDHDDRCALAFRNEIHFMRDLLTCAVLIISFYQFSPQNPSNECAREIIHEYHKSRDKVRRESAITISNHPVLN